MTERIFTDKVAIVTGAGSGIGAAIARELGREGAEVVVSDVEAKSSEAVAEEIRKAGGKAQVCTADVADAKAVEALVDFAVRECGGLHLAVNNAGIGGPSEKTGDYPLDGWRQVIDINLNGVFYGLRYQIPAMLQSGGGAIVNMASILGSVGFAKASAYVAAKHALVGLTKTAGMEYATEGVRINAVGPAFIDTPLLSKNLDEETLGQLAGLHPVQRLGTAEEVSALTCFLLSERASFITGSYHLVDGGYTAQ
ncbi:SDR family NAD(P)-dependent oxidoreductase [Fodinicurvata fenggangensis]|uniref:SDR family NAD(P)-dependent oxidoreductase n=1 Tax=Fodinicurvata fenggangensis TaxID=1121830 RepID=UPI00047D9781|nr:SDR family NAD(P)-dependent oxidoreductase [Fodinicurvata fenggangensis]